MYVDRSPYRECPVDLVDLRLPGVCMEITTL